MEVPIQDLLAVATSLVPEAVVQGHLGPPEGLQRPSVPPLASFKRLGNLPNLPTPPNPGHLHGPNFLAISNQSNASSDPSSAGTNATEGLSPPRHCVPVKHENQPCLCMTQNGAKFNAISSSQNPRKKRSRYMRVHHCCLWNYSRSSGRKPRYGSPLASSFSVKK